MEIGPITGMRALPIKAPTADLGLPAVFDIENFARINDETYSPSNGRSESGMDDSLDDIEEFDEIYVESEEDNEAALSVYAGPRETVHHLSCFA